MARHQVHVLLMGGQACVFYGAAEFSRDTDLLILCESGNLERLRLALSELQAKCIDVPPFEPDYLQRGHAVHFRCAHSDAPGMRIDIMSVLRGVEPFEVLWERRAKISDSDGTVYELISLPDLVRAKRTQRDKLWPMLRRLLEADYEQHKSEPSESRVSFWLRELRTPELLMDLVREHPALARELMGSRPALGTAIAENFGQLVLNLEGEQKREMELDRQYWRPLREELERLRHEIRRR